MRKNCAFFSVLLLVCNQAKADQFDHLTPRFSGTSAGLNAVACSTNGYVAVGNNGLILTTTDAISWTAQTSTTSNDLRGATWANGLFVVVGSGGTVLSSTDGATWNPETSGTTNRLNGVSWYNGTFVAAGDAGIILFSTNGLQWNSAIPTGIAYNLTGVVGNNGFVAVGDSGTILTSADGKAWTIRSSGTLLGLNAVFGNTSIYGSLNVVVGQSGVILTGSGSSWTVVYSGTTANLRGVAFDAAGYYSGAPQPNYPIGVFGVVGDGGTFLTSSDGGNTWNIRPTETTNNLLGATFENGGFLAVGDSGSIQAGFIWVKRSSGVTTLLDSIAFGSNRFVAVGQSGTILTSTNGAGWLVCNSGTTNDLVKVIFANNRFMAVGGQTFDISADGVDWTSQIITGVGTFNQNGVGYNTNLDGIAYGNGVIVAIASFQESDGPSSFNLTSVLMSSNAANWIAESNPLTPLGGLAFGASVFSGGVVTSPDGVNWTTNSGPSSGISFVNGRFYATGGYTLGGHVGSQIIYSSDGSNWVSTASGYVSGLPCYGHSALVAVGQLGSLVGATCYLTSSDGTNWTSRGASDFSIEGDPNLNSTAFGDGKFVAVGANGTIYTSVPVPDLLNVSKGAQGANVTLTGDIGRTVLLETSTNLTAGLWSVLLGITNAPYSTNYTDPVGNTVGFYRSIEP